MLEGDLKVAEQLKKEFKVPDKRHVMWLYCQLNIAIVLIEALSLHDKALW